MGAEDTLIVYNGPTPSATVLASFSGNLTTKKYITSSTSTVYIYMMTRTNSNSRGFSISYKRGCDLSLNDPYGEIISPGYLESQYPNDISCTYTIENENLKADRSLSLIPNRFDLADDDSIKIFENGPKGKALHDGPDGFSAKNKPEKQIDSEANRLQVVFKSSASRQAMGFNFSYSIEGDVFQSFGRTLMFKELLKIDAKAIDDCRHELIQEADLMNESIMADALLHYPNSDVLIWQKKYWMFTRKSRLFLLCALCVDPPELSPLFEIQQFFIALTEALNRKIMGEMKHLQNPYFTHTREELYFAKNKSTFLMRNYSYHRMNEYDTDSLLLNERAYCAIRVYEKYRSEKEATGIYAFRRYLCKEVLQKIQKSFENALRKDPLIKQLLTEAVYFRKKMNCAIVSPDGSQYSHIVNVPVEKERVVKVESSQTFDCFEAKNEKEEEQVYQQCVQKMHVLDEIKRFDVKEFYKKKKNFKENSSDRNSVYEDSLLSTHHHIQLTPCQKEVTVHSQKSEKSSGIPTVRMKPDSPIPLQKPGLQKPEDVACGGFSERKTKRRFREEPRPRTDPPKDSVITYDYDVKSVKCKLSRHDSCDDWQLPDSSRTGDLSEKTSRTFIESIRPLKDPPVQVTTCDKMKQPVHKFDHDFYWSDTSSKLIMKDSYQCADTPDPWNLMTTYWRGAQEEYRPRKDPPTLLHHQHLPWRHHGSTLVMAHG
ncbi:unnamed protein product [Caenorhabditis brenneri]